MASTSTPNAPEGDGRYRVVTGTQVHHAGELHTAGQEFDAPREDAVEWLARGYVTEVAAKRRKR